MNYAHSDEEYLVLQTRNSVHLLFIAQGEGLNLSLQEVCVGKQPQAINIQEERAGILAFCTLHLHLQRTGGKLFRFHESEAFGSGFWIWSCSCQQHTLTQNSLPFLLFSHISSPCLPAYPGNLSNFQSLKTSVKQRKKKNNYTAHLCAHMKRVIFRK